MGVDPGVTTGVVVLHVAENLIVPELLVTEFHWEDRFKIYFMLNECLPSAIVYETFRLYPSAVEKQVYSSFPSVEFIGLLSMAVYILGLETQIQGMKWEPRIVSQSASQISRVQIPDHFVPMLTSEHLKDAFKHARLFFVRYLREQKQ